jgi:hypothetical protein
VERLKTGRTSVEDTYSYDQLLVKEQIEQSVESDQRIGEKSSGNAEVK